MNARKLQRRLQWYQVSGRSVDTNVPVVAFVEATSRQKVLKYHGGCRKRSGCGKDLLIQFPTETKDVRPLGKHLNQDRLHLGGDAIIEVIPVTTYRCSCGRELRSEHPYPSVWCSCGQRAVAVTTNPLD